MRPPSQCPSHRSACLYTLSHGGALDSLRKNQGGELLYSLYVNIDAVWESLSNFSVLLKNPPTVTERSGSGTETEMRFTPAAESVFTCSSKHGIPISAALGSNSAESFQKMSGCRKAFFDNAVAGFSAVVDESAANELIKSNLAAVVAPQILGEQISLGMVHRSELGVRWTRAFEPRVVNGRTVADLESALDGRISMLSATHRAGTAPGLTEVAQTFGARLTAVHLVGGLSPHTVSPEFPGALFTAFLKCALTRGFAGRHAVCE